MARKDDLITHVDRLVAVARSAHLKRALTEIDPTPRLNFWRLIYGNLLDVAVLEWCKVFGTDAEPTHWKKVIADHESFRKGLLATLEIDEATWAAYWKEMKYYRDNRVSHHLEDADLERWPKLDLALESSYYYYAHLIKELRGLGDTKFPENLREYSARFSAQAIAVAKTALSSTAGVIEKVY